MVDFLLYRMYRLAAVNRRWRNRRFTGTGFLVLGGLGASAIVGLDTNQTMAFQAFSFLFFLVCIAFAWCLFFRVRFTLKRILPRFGTVQEPLTYRIVVHNGSGKNQSGLLVGEKLESTLPTFEEFSTSREPGEHKRHLFDRFMKFRRWQWLERKNLSARVKEQPLDHLLPNARSEVKFELVPLKRGYIRFSAVTITRPDPFGLINAHCRLPLFPDSSPAR